jgi:hypothetical protein
MEVPMKLRLRYTTRTLLVATAIVAIWMGWRARVYYRHNQALARIGKLGGGAAHVGMAPVRLLTLRRTQITDASVDHILAIGRGGKLHTLVLYDTQITPAAVERLRQELPDCTIKF